MSPQRPMISAGNSSERLFAALLLPADWINAIERHQSRLARRYENDVKWVSSDSYHITARFFGDLPIDAAIALRDSWPTLPITLPEPITVSPASWGCFPSATAPRVLWAGVAVSQGGWSALLAAIDHHLGSLGVTYTRTESTPHITIGRVRNHARTSGLGEKIAAHRLTSESFVATRLHLMASIPSPTGTRYVSCAERSLEDMA